MLKNDLNKEAINGKQRKLENIYPSSCKVQTVTSQAIEQLVKL